MDVYWIWLSQIPYVGPIAQKRLLEVYSTPRNVYELEEKELWDVDGLNTRAVMGLLENRSLEKAERILEKVKQTSTKLLTYDSPFYPSHAKNCPVSPVVLYARGQLRPVDQAVAVVGTRHCTDYGKRIAEELGWKLASLDIPVLSGLAKGIDGYAQTACLRQDGYTMAFVAGGPDICYPKEHMSLYEKIVEQGAVISRYPPGTKPHPKYFLQRNGLMAAWASHVVVVEAGRKSGALTTADFATQFGRKLFAVPNRVDVPESLGANGLFGQGASPYIDFSSLQFSQGDISISCDDDDDGILSILRHGPKTFEELVTQLNAGEEELRERIFGLELEGMVFLRGRTVILS